MPAAPGARMMQRMAASRIRLTPLDATFLELEEADAAAHMHIGSLMIFEATGSRPPALPRLRRHVESRLDSLPRYRCRLSQSHTGGLHWPEWVPDPDFDVGLHLAHVRLPEPGGEQELRDWAAAYWSQRLDRSRPLWDARLVTGLEGGRWAIATKTHHALVDGVGSVDALYLFLDPSRRPHGALDVPQPAPPAESGPLHLVRDAARHGLYAARHPGRLRDAFLHAKAIAEVVVKDEVVAAPRCTLNAPISGDRAFTAVRADLAELKGVKAALGGTVNDVILAAVTSGLRSLLLERGDPVPAPGLRAMVPVNLRSAAERFGLGNRVSSLFVHLPVMEPDPGHRYLLVAAETTDLKRADHAGGAAELISIGGLAPPVLHSVFARSALATRLFNLTITNVPGPQMPLYGLGARMEEVWPLVPLAADHRIGVAVVSYDGQVFFGLNGDVTAAADIDLVAEGIEAGIAELAALAATGHALPTLG
jgi:WS/DGAT/MGAT family acyltransferase